MLEQYLSLKQKYPDCILLFRLGDFYEGFQDDAKILSKVLGITLTGRGKEDNRIPMAGIPYHALNQYLPKLVKAGHKVAIAEQQSDPEPGKLVMRDVTKIVTAGTIMDEDSLTPSSNNYIVCLYVRKKQKLRQWGIAYADLTTGEFRAGEFQGDKAIPRELVTEVFRIRPAEVIALETAAASLQNFPDRSLHFLDAGYALDTVEAERRVTEFFGTKNLRGLGWENTGSGIAAAAILLQYLENTQKSELAHIKTLGKINLSDHMLMDQTTIRSLELIYPLQNNENSRTLYDSLNLCLSAMGQRLLRQWLLRPLLKPAVINSRLDVVEAFYKHSALLENVRSELDGIPDLERILARIGTKSANARDLSFLAKSLQKLLQVSRLIKKAENKAFLRHFDLNFGAQEIQENVIDLVNKAIRDDSPPTITEGNIIRSGYNAELDELKNAEKAGKNFISSFQVREIKRTGISSLKVKFNSVFGYYIEISRSNLAKAPQNYIRKQTLVNAERFITEELKEWEDKILGAEEKAAALEYRIFEDVRASVLKYISIMLKLAALAAELDVLSTFAYLAQLRRYVRPNLTENKATVIKAGRHPVVELTLQEGFIENDLHFSDEQSLIILTGPNMSGKSTYIRQAALIFIMAQTGSFVPAESARIAIADRIFTRVGASDNLAAGESTFMVEMSETANILNNATSKSLLILDEIGRGTSTYDGVAIAWAVAEFISQQLRARTLFATHYHELISLEEELDNVKNFNVEVSEDNGKVLFMHKIRAGATDQSYGVYVAKIAGVPRQVTNRAEKILKLLERKNLQKAAAKDMLPESQISFYELNTDSELSRELKELDLDSLTPLNALTKLKELQDKV